MKGLIKLLLMLLLPGFYYTVKSQQIQIPKEQLIALTSEWKGERFADGRPKIPDDLVVQKYLIVYWIV